MLAGMTIAQRASGKIALMKPEQPFRNIVLFQISLLNALLLPGFLLGNNTNDFSWELSAWH
jgi:hypothetical protein